MQSLPSVQHFAVEPQLQSETITAVSPREMRGRQSSGNSRQLTYSGTWADMQLLMQQQLALGSLASQVQCSLSRQPGGKGLLSVTITEYLAAEEDDDNGSGMEAQNVGTSEENPEYQYEFAEVQEPIMTHPLIADAFPRLSEEARAVLGYLAKGGQKGDIVWLPSGKQMRVVDAINYFNIDPLLVRIVEIPHYLDVKVALTVSWSVDPTTPVQIPAGMVISPPAGPLQTPGGRNWLYVGGGYTQKGDDVRIVKKYLLSAPGGWDTSIYSSS